MRDNRASVSVSPGIVFYEATVHGGQSVVLQPGQLEPFNPGYECFNTMENFIVPDSTITELLGIRMVEGEFLCSPNLEFKKLGPTACIICSAFSNKPFPRAP